MLVTMNYVSMKRRMRFLKDMANQFRIQMEKACLM